MTIRVLNFPVEDETIEKVKKLKAKWGLSSQSATIVRAIDEMLKKEVK